MNLITNWQIFCAFGLHTAFLSDLKVMGYDDSLLSDGVIDYFLCTLFFNW